MMATSKNRAECVWIARMHARARSADVSVSIARASPSPLCCDVASAPHGAVASASRRICRRGPGVNARHHAGEGLHVVVAQLKGADDLAADV